MSGIVWAPIGHVPDETLVVLDATTRLYAARSRAGDGWHVVQPVRVDDRRAPDDARVAGQLVCGCPGGVYRGACWALALAEAFEAGRVLPDPEPAWLQEPKRGLDNPAGAGELVEAFRG
jgi:hypothetical protein